MLGLQVDVTGFYTLAEKDHLLSPLAQHFLGLKPPRFPSLFEALLNAFACQQVSLDVGIMLLNRLTAMYGMKFDDGQPALSAFPEPEAFANTSVEHIRALGFSHQKARAITELATALVKNQQDFSLLEAMNDEEAKTSLSPIRGVGRWTAEYVLLRGLGRLDTFPGDDVGAQKNLQQLLHLEEKPSYGKIKEVTSSWQPYAGFVYFHLLLNKLEKQGILSQA
jgi:DNA-3-methyladenine glycosylase II